MRTMMASKMSMMMRTASPSRMSKLKRKKRNLERLLK